MKRSEIGTLAVGMVLGAVLTSGAAAAGVVAEPSWSPIYVDGQQVQMTAYNIAGNNYVKLRDIGQAVGFNVYWADGVQVDSTAPYTGAAPAQSKTAISLSSYKGSTLTAGDRSGLIVGSDRADCMVTSGNPAVIAIEQVSGNWVAVAKTAGTATITVSDGTGGTGSLTLTVEDTSSTLDTPNTAPSSIDLNANMEIRQEMIRLINQVRREHGVAELTVNEALMNATQDISTHHFTEHTPYEWEAMQAYGWPYGGANNQTCFNQATESNIAQRAVANWVKSPPHFQSMLREDATYVGVGVTVDGDFAYCHMFVGDPNGHSPL